MQQQIMHTDTLLQPTNSDITSFISDNTPTIFPDCSTIMKDKKQWFQHSNISAMLLPIHLKNFLFVYFIINEHIGLE